MEMSRVAVTRFLTVAIPIYSVAIFLYMLSMAQSSSYHLLKESTSSKVSNSTPFSTNKVIKSENPRRGDVFNESKGSKLKHTHANNSEEKLKNFIPTKFLNFEVDSSQLNDIPRTELYIANQSAANSLAMPSGIQKCHLLQHNLTADCSAQGWNDVPSGLPKSIRNLNLSQNRLTTIKSRAFSQYPLLETLNLSSNSIQSINGKSFDGIYKLMVLDLEKNFLNFTNCSVLCCKKPFLPLQQLSYLNIKENNPRTKPTALDKCLMDLENLETLKVNFVTEARFGVGFQNLTKLSNLDMSYSWSLRLINVDFFDNLQNSPIENLSLAYCSIKRIHPDALSNLRLLKVLDLSSNMQLGLLNMNNALSGVNKSTLKVLYINRLVDPWVKICINSIVEPKIFENIHLTNLTELHMDYNCIYRFRESALQLLPQSLVILSLRHNRLKYPYKFSQPLINLVNLEVLDAKGQHSHRKSVESGKSSAPVKSDLVSLTKTSVIPMPPKLSTLIFTHAISYRFRAPYVKFVNCTLKKVISTNNIMYGVSVYITGLETVEYMDLSHNDLIVNPGFFDGFPNLYSLLLTHNQLNTSFARDSHGTLFQKLHHLTKLILSDNGISNLAENIFSNNSLLVHLSLNINQLTRLGARIGHLTRLRTLRLDQNSFAYLTSTEMHDMDNVARHGTLHIDLRHNPLVCSCESLPFLKWVLSEPKNITLLGVFQGSCLAPNGSLILMRDLKGFVKELEIICASYIVLVVSLSLALLGIIIVSGALVYRFRWKLRYIYHVRLLRKFTARTRRRLRTGYEPIDGNDLGERYDVFIAYADEDSSFVLNEMRPVLEDNHNIRMYIRDRDSIGGFEIATNITRAVHISTTTILLASRSFLRNKWCYYEYQMAIQEGVDRRRQVILCLLYENIPTQQIPAEMLSTMKSCKSLEVPNSTGNQNDMEAFWTMLVDTLRKTMNHNHE